MKENSVDTGFERFAFRIQQWQLFVLLYNLRFLKFLIRFQERNSFFRTQGACEGTLENLKPSNILENSEITKVYYLCRKVVFIVAI